MSFSPPIGLKAFFLYLIIFTTLAEYVSSYGYNNHNQNNDNNDNVNQDDDVTIINNDDLSDQYEDRFGYYRMNRYGQRIYTRCTNTRFTRRENCGRGTKLKTEIVVSGRNKYRNGLGGRGNYYGGNYGNGNGGYGRDNYGTRFIDGVDVGLGGFIGGAINGIVGGVGGIGGGYPYPYPQPIVPGRAVSIVTKYFKIKNKLKIGKLILLKY